MPKKFFLPSRPKKDTESAVFYRYLGNRRISISPFTILKTNQQTHKQKVKNPHFSTDVEAALKVKRGFEMQIHSISWKGRWLQLDNDAHCMTERDCRMIRNEAPLALRCTLVVSSPLLPFYPRWRRHFHCGD